MWFRIVLVIAAIAMAGFVWMLVAGPGVAPPGATATPAVQAK